MRMSSVILQEKLRNLARSVPVSDLKRVTRADVKEWMDYWKQEDESLTGTDHNILKEESVRYQMVGLVWHGLQDFIAKLEEEEANE